ncbi:MAG: methyl-accepting chemotaxis protein [Limnohabitans sp.]|nr:methyl-accepting chemotaxis protein [Limnohabitans sp.]
MAARLAFHRSLLGRSMLYGVVPAVLVVLAVVTLNGVRAWTNLEASLKRDLLSATELAAAEIDIRNEKTVRLVEFMAFAQESGQFGRRAESLAMLERIMRESPDVYAAYIGYEPNADGNDAQGAVMGVPEEALGEGGRFYPYFKRDPKAIGGIRVEPLQEVDDDEGLWYRVPKERFERSRVRDAVITKPYSYFGTDIIETVVPIVMEGRFAGIVGLDVALTDVQARLSQIARELGADIFLETRGRFLAASTDIEGEPALRTTDIALSPLRSIFEETPTQGVRLDERVDPNSGESCYFVSATVPTGNWRIVVRKPTSAVLGQLSGLFIANMLTAIAGIIIIVSLLAALSIGMSRRVQLAKETAERIASGDLASDITAEVAAVKVQDESADLLRAMARMNGDLATIVESVRAASLRLSATSVELAANSRQQEMTVNAFGASTAQIAAAIREISATGAELLRAVEHVEEGARRTATSATASRASLDGMAKTLTRLDEAAGDIGGRLRVIAEKASSITVVVETIAKVAEQTNLLSVNAAIEAEKAGEAGLGFLVVSREIRRLADQTAMASLDIERIVRQMQDAVSTGVTEMDRFAVEMRSGTASAQRVTTDLAAIIDDMDASAVGFAEVERGMSAQGIGVTQIESAVRQVADGARQSSVSVAEFGRVADELAHATAVLQDAVARFHLSTSMNRDTASDSNCGAR